MKTFLLVFSLLTLAARGADVNPRESFAVYPEVPKGTSGAIAFECSAPLSGEKYFGFYLSTPVLTLSHLADGGSGYPEAGAAPFPALWFSFTDDGFKRLQGHLKGKQPSNLVVFIDGHAYARLEPADIRDIVEHRRDIRDAIEHRSRLQILIRSALDNKAELDRLLGKLKAARERGEK